jgi:phage baseplate assembly protein W
MSIEIRDFLGKGPIAPLRRLGAQDFIFGAGAPLIRSAIHQIVGTERGEVRWRPGFGLRLNAKRHKLNNEDLKDELRAEVDTAIRAFEPRVDLNQVEVRQEGPKIVIKVGWQPIERNVPGNQVILGPEITEVTV